MNSEAKKQKNTDLHVKIAGCRLQKTITEGGICFYMQMHCVTAATGAPPKPQDRTSLSNIFPFKVFTFILYLSLFSQILISFFSPGKFASLKSQKYCIILMDI